MNVNVNAVLINTQVFQIIIIMCVTKNMEWAADRMFSAFSKEVDRKFK